MIEDAVDIVQISPTGSGTSRYTTGITSIDSNGAVTMAASQRAQAIAQASAFRQRIRVAKRPLLVESRHTEVRGRNKQLAYLRDLEQSFSFTRAARERHVMQSAQRMRNSRCGGIVARPDLHLQQFREREPVRHSWAEIQRRVWQRSDCIAQRQHRGVGSGLRIERQEVRRGIPVQSARKNDQRVARQQHG